MIEIRLSKEEYVELLDLVALGNFLKTGHVIPESLQQLMSLPSHKLNQKLLGKAQSEGLGDFVYQEDDLPLAYLREDDLLDTYLEL